MKIIKFISPKNVIKLINYWPTFFFSGIRVKEVQPDIKRIVVEMKQHWWNTNYVGTHFGGNLYAMTDPFYMFILLNELKEEHIIWDQSADINFLKPGKGTVTAEFLIDEKQFAEIKAKALKEFSHSIYFKVEIKDKKKEVIATVKKTLYIRRKDAKKRFIKK